MTRPFDPLRIGPLTLRNRFIKAATNEAMTVDGAPSRALVEHHRAIAAGGAALTTVAYLAVAADGRTLANQIWLRPEVVPDLRALADAVHGAGGAVCGQLTHGGSFVTGLKLARPAISASAGVNKAGLLAGNMWQRAMTGADMDAVCADFAASARRCEEAGFDAVEIHMGHGYLLNQFISPLSNTRRDSYGGTVANRMRFPLRVLDAVKQAVGGRLAVLVKLNAADGVKGGSTAEDAAESARLLEARGADLLVLSSGRNMESVWFMFGSPMNMPAMRQALGHSVLQRAFLRLASLGVPQDLAFRDLYRLAEARVIRAAVGLPLAYLGGAVSMPNAQAVLDDGFDAVAMGRALLHEPGLIDRFRRDPAARSGCTHCNACVFTIYHADGTRCVLHPPNDPALNRMRAAL